MEKKTSPTLTIREEIDLDYFEECFLQWSPIEKLKTNFDMMQTMYIAYKDDKRAGMLWTLKIHARLFVGLHKDIRTDLKLLDCFKLAKIAIANHKQKYGEQLFFGCFKEEKYAILLSRKLNFTLIDDNYGILSYQV